MERIAVISDLHGNLTAFEAVLADIDARGIGTILNLGDVAGKGPRGSECVALSQARCALTVRGNWDDFLPTGNPDWTDPALHWWHAQLTAADREWLVTLPLSHDLVLSGRNIRFVHASAESVYVRVHFHHTDEQFAGMFANTELTGDGPLPSVVCYGDIHDAYIETEGGRSLVNVGSVGNSLDEPTASYVILEGVADGSSADPFGVQFVRVAYDIEAEIAQTIALRMPSRDEYAIELRTAIYRGLQVELGLRA